MRRFGGVGLAAGLAAFGLAASASAGTVTVPAGYGVAGYYGGALTGDTYYNSSIPFFATASGSFGGGSGSVTISATPANGNVGLHGFASASYGGEFEAGWGEAEFDLYAYDTFQISGQPGTYEQFQYTLTLNGSASTTTNGYPEATAAYGSLALVGDANWIAPGEVIPSVSCDYGVESNGNPCGVLSSLYLNPSAPASQTVTGILTLAGGTSIQLGEYLWSRDFASQATDASAQFNAADTGFFTLVPITPGASFTTASGLTYAASPDVGEVPEPATWAMLILGIGMVGFAARRRRDGMAAAA